MTSICSPRGWREWDGAPWDAVEAHLATNTGVAAVERAQLLGIPAALAVPPPENPVCALDGPLVPVSAHIESGLGGGGAARAPLVVDLAALWAGPLCTRLLGSRGARVVKVELAGRPDGARAGDPAFWRLLNGDKEEVVVDLGAARGRAELEALLDAADVVVTASRPRAIEQLGLGLERRIAERGLVWASITGYGFRGEWRDRVAFGDDAAVAGGLAVAAGGPDTPVFVGDAPADPLAGLHAAAAVSARLEAGTGAFVDVSMCDGVGDALARATTTLD
jgi:crotonobetainyl-CoA:carnitine CoA-transferase CaiB-like acyl-CoA transferase